jgi:hypothetical protein
VPLIGQPPRSAFPTTPEARAELATASGKNGQRGCAKQT